MMVYVHIPFCLSKCAYCDFNSYAGAEALIPAYLRTLEREMDAQQADWQRERVTSVYFGGGTPSLLSPGQIGELLDAVEERFELEPAAEITVEMNPATWDEEAMCEAVGLGVTRLSIGVQSLRDGTLRELGRPHNAEAARDTLCSAVASGAASLSADLIYGVPGQSLEEWKQDLREIVDLGVPHISAYALTLEGDTPLAAREARGEFVLPDEDETALLYFAACSELAAKGYEHYEISNFARPGHACRHNAGYWDRRPYLGLGAGAHSFNGEVRRWAPNSLAAYSEAALAGCLTYGEERIDTTTARSEEIMLGLRTARGLDAGTVKLDERTWGAWAREGWLSATGDRLCLTDAGMLLSNELISSLLRHV